MKNEELRLFDHDLRLGDKIVVPGADRDQLVNMIANKWMSQQIPAGTENAMLCGQTMIDPRLFPIISALGLTDQFVDERVERANWDLVTGDPNIGRGFVYAMASGKELKPKCADVAGYLRDIGVDYDIDGVTPAPIGDENPEQVNPSLMGGMAADAFAAKTIEESLFLTFEKNPDGLTPRAMRNSLKRIILQFAREQREDHGLPPGSWGKKSTCPRATMTVTSPPLSPREPGWSLQVGDIPEYGIGVDGTIYDLTHPNAAIYANFAADHHDRMYGVIARLAERRSVGKESSRNHLQERYNLKIGVMNNQVDVVPITDDPDLFDEMWPIPKSGMRVTPVEAKYIMRLKYSDGFAENLETALFLALLNNDSLMSYRYGIATSINQVLNNNSSRNKPEIFLNTHHLTRKLARYISSNTPHRHERKGNGQADDMSFVMHSMYVEDFEHGKTKSQYDHDVLLKIWMKAQTQVLNDLERSKVVPCRAEYEDVLADQLFVDVFGSLVKLLGFGVEEMSSSEVVLLNRYVLELMQDAQIYEETARVARRG